MTQRYQVLLAYDGFAYHGWQKQINGLSVQEVIEKRLKKSINRRPQLQLPEERMQEFMRLDRSFILMRMEKSVNMDMNRH